MVLTVNSGLTLIGVDSPLLDLFIASPSSYEYLEVASNDGTDSSVTTYSFDSGILITGISDVSTVGGAEFFKPAILGNATTFKQGLHTFVIKLDTGAEIHSDEACIFVEGSLACDIDTYINLETTTLTNKLEVGIDYYLLKNSQNCPCKCTELQTIYDKIVLTLGDNKCKTC